MKNQIPVPVMIAAIAVVVLVVGIFGYRSLIQSKPAHQSGGIHPKLTEHRGGPGNSGLMNGQGGSQPTSPTTGGN